MDENLNEILDKYAVPDADDALLERIISNTDTFRRSANLKRFYICTGLFLSLSVFGFFLGNGFTGSENQKMFSQYRFIAQSILTPQNLNDIIL